MQREQSCTLLWLRTTLTRYWPNFISHFQARLQIRNGFQLLLKIKQHFSTRGLSPSVLFLLLSWSHIGSRSQNNFKIRAFNLRVKNISTLDTRCISLIVVCSVIQKQGSQAFLLNFFILFFIFMFKVRPLRSSYPTATEDNTGIVINFPENVQFLNLTSKRQIEICFSIWLFQTDYQSFLRYILRKNIFGMLSTYQSHENWAFSL